MNNEQYVEEQLRELVKSSLSKENIIYAIGMIYEHTIIVKKTLEPFCFPCGMNMTFTYNNTTYESSPISIEIEPTHNTYTRPLCNVVFPMMSITYTPQNKENFIQFMEKRIR